MKRARIVAAAAAAAAAVSVEPFDGKVGVDKNERGTSDERREDEESHRKPDGEQDLGVVDDDDDGSSGGGGAELHLDERINYLRQCEGAWSAEQEQRLRRELPTEMLREALLTCGRSPCKMHSRPRDYKLRVEANTETLRRLSRVLGSIFPRVERVRPVSWRLPTAIWLHALTWCTASDMYRVALVSRAFRLATCASDAWHSIAVKAPLELNLRRFMRTFPAVLARARSIEVEGADSRNAIMHAFALVSRSADAPPPSDTCDFRYADEDENADPRGTDCTDCMAQPSVGGTNRYMQSFKMSDSYYHQHAVHMLAREFSARLCAALPNLRRLELRLTRIRWTAASIQAMLDHLPLLHVLVRSEMPPTGDAPIAVLERTPVVLSPSLVEYRDESHAAASLPIAFASAASLVSSLSSSSAASVEVLQVSASTPHSDFGELRCAARLRTLWYRSDPYTHAPATDESEATLRCVALHPSLTELKIDQSPRRHCRRRQRPRDASSENDGDEPTADRSDSLPEDDVDAELLRDCPAHLARPLMRRLTVFSSTAPYFEFSYIGAYSHLRDVRFLRSGLGQVSTAHMMRALRKCAAFRCGRLVYVQFPGTRDDMFLPSSAPDDSEASAPCAVVGDIATTTTETESPPKDFGTEANDDDYDYDDDVFDFKNTQAFAWSAFHDSLLLVPHDLGGGDESTCTQHDGDLHVQTPLRSKECCRRYPVAIADRDLAHLLARRRRRRHPLPDSKEYVQRTAIEPEPEPADVDGDDWPPCVVAFVTVADRKADAPAPRVAAPSRECPFRGETLAERHCYCAAPAAEWQCIADTRWAVHLSATSSAHHRSSPLGARVAPGVHAINSIALMNSHN